MRKNITKKSNKKKVTFELEMQRISSTIHPCVGVGVEVGRSSYTATVIEMVVMVVMLVVVEVVEVIIKAK